MKFSNKDKSVVILAAWELSGVWLQIGIRNFLEWWNILYFDWVGCTPMISFTVCKFYLTLNWKSKSTNWEMFRNWEDKEGTRDKSRRVCSTTFFCRIIIFLSRSHLSRITASLVSWRSRLNWRILKSDPYLKYLKKSTPETLGWNCSLWFINNHHQNHKVVIFLCFPLPLGKSS